MLTKKRCGFHCEFHELIYDIRKDEPEVRPLLSTPPESIDCVSELLKNSVEKQGTTFREPISVEECLGVTLIFTRTTWRYGQQSYPLILFPVTGKLSYQWASTRLVLEIGSSRTN